MEFRRHAIAALSLTAFGFLSGAGAQVYEKVFSFTDARAAERSRVRNLGANPWAGLLQGPDGSFYGTTEFGGERNLGTAFKMTAGGVLTTLLEFTKDGMSNRGSRPLGNLVLGRDGNFYGTTRNGGADDFGTVFKLTPAGVLTTLVEFTGVGGSDKGGLPGAGLVLGSDGNFYGTTENGGADNVGTIFKMTPAGVLTTVIEFIDHPASRDGGAPRASLVEGIDGNFYGTTGGAQDDQGTVFNRGTVFRMTPAGVLTTLVEFSGTTGNHKGSFPRGNLVLGNDGSFYGTTLQGGVATLQTPAGLGTVFRMTPEGVLTTLVEFTRNPAIDNGGLPYSLMLGSDGNFYGTTLAGGVSAQGTIFKMTPAGELTPLVEFPDFGRLRAHDPRGALAQGRDGNFYGTTHGTSTVFRMTPTGVLTTLVEFTGSGRINTGGAPIAGLVEDSDGNFYGTTSLGGVSHGTVFKMTPAGSLTTLVEFTGTEPGNKGRQPFGRLLRFSNGNFYGTTQFGGAHDRGTIFTVTPAGVLTTLVEFTGNGAINTGAEPLTGIVKGSDGNLYGTTSSGGVLKDVFGFFSNHGTVFKMTPAGALTTLAEFTGFSGERKGRVPYGDLVQGSDGDFYGTTRFGGANFIGTAFKMTPLGALTTLVEFTGNGGMARGSGPISSLVQFSNGNLCGTTSTGGVSSRGTVFEMTPGGVLNTLVDFTGDGPINKGDLPYGGLVQASDGNFYGTTAKGGSDGRGTIFQMTPAGVLRTVFDFVADPQDAFPTGTLLAAMDGNLYGTASGYAPGDVAPSNPGGGVFRIIFPGRPSIFLLDAESRLDGSVVVQAKFNARRAVSTVILEYGTDGVAFPNRETLSVSLNGDQTTLLGTSLVGLRAGVIYRYRFRATNSFGETVSSIASFTRLAAPTAVATPASDLEPRTARFNGRVNAQNYDASVVFEYGTDGNTFPNLVRDVVPATVTGAEDVLVSARPEEQLSEGTTYYYRLVATNAGGATVSGVTSFRTLERSELTLGGALALNTTTARVHGIVNPRGSDTEVAFEYGTNGVDFPNSMDAMPAVVPGGAGAVPVSALLPNLLQGTTYYYRIRGTSAGGAGLSEVGTFALDVLSGFVQRPPGVPPEAKGFILVNLEPTALLTAPGIKPAWRFVGEQEWRVPGVPVGGLTTGDRQIEFRPVPGWLQPLREPVTITSGAAATVVEKEYFEAASGGVTGSITVTLKPDSLATATVPQSQRAQWRLLGEGDPGVPGDESSPTWRDSGATAIGLVPGAYLVELKPVAGRTTPAPLVVNVTTRIVDVNGGPTEVADARNVSATYFAAEATGGTSPAVLPFETVAANAALPYAHVGQIRSDLGVATGFVVKAQPTRSPELGARVVLTAAHVVFDDAKLTAAPLGTPTDPPADLSGFATTGLQWLHQRDRGSFEPIPQKPRGFYVLAGYAAKRIIERTPGEAAPQSQTLDVAALYFFEDVGRGGFAGFLASDAADNEWLASNALKTLVGYPTGEEVPPANRGRMHATPPANVRFSAGPGRTFTTSGIRSSGGHSGGPLCVQFEGGLYYPAAIFLGGTGQSVVRAIDSDVIDLFERAEISGNTAVHNTNGGVPRLDAPEGAGTFEAASLRVNLGPAEAVNRGAKWKLGATGRERADNALVTSLAPGNYTVRFTDVSGFITPNPVVVTLRGGVEEPPLERTYHGIIGQPEDRTVNAFARATFTVDTSGTPQRYQWQRNGMNIQGETSPTLTRQNVTASDAGNYRVVVTWNDGTVTSSAGTLTVRPIDQSIDFAPLAKRGRGESPLILGAAASSGLPVTFMVVSGPATVNGPSLALTGFGNVTIRALQSGNGNYDAASPVEQSFLVTGEDLASWRARLSAQEELEADSDGDGVNTLLEFALNLNPKEPTQMSPDGTGGLPVVRVEDIGGQQRLTAEFVRRRAASFPGITYSFEFTSSLANRLIWSPGIMESVTQIDEIWERVKVADPETRSPRFGRLRVTQP